MFTIWNEEPYQAQQQPSHGDEQVYWTSKTHQEAFFHGTNTPIFSLTLQTQLEQSSTAVMSRGLQRDFITSFKKRVSPISVVPEDLPLTSLWPIYHCDLRSETF